MKVTSIEIRKRELPSNIEIPSAEMMVAKILFAGTFEGSLEKFCHEFFSSSPVLEAACVDYVASLTQNVSMCKYYQLLANNSEVQLLLQNFMYNVLFIQFADKNSTSQNVGTPLH